MSNLLLQEKLVTWGCRTASVAPAMRDAKLRNQKVKPHTTACTMLKIYTVNVKISSLDIAG
jgi:hypothetical protein